jgi:acyl-CoA dehydrogenase
MAFDLTPTAAQHGLARRAHEFAESVIRPVALDYDQRQELPWPVLEEAAQRGFYSPLFYRDLIGDPTGLSLPMFMEELFWGCAGIGLAIVMPALALSAIGQAASPEQMLQWAPECFGTPGDLKLAALAISEPEGGSDVRNLRTCARRDGDDWIIDGHKMWIGNGGIANVHVVNAVVDEELGHRGQALFVVPGGTPGLEMVRKLDKLGCRASHTAELRLNGVRVPAANLLGGQEKLEHKLAKAREVVAGGKRSGSATLGTFEQTRPMVAAQAIGIARRAGVCDVLRHRARGVRRAHHRQPGHRIPAGGLGNPDRRCPVVDLACLLDGRQRSPLRPRRGLDVEARRQRGRREGHRACGPDAGRLGLHHRPPLRELVSRCQAVHHL